MPSCSSLSLLIVDDEPSIRQGLYYTMPWEELNISVIGQAANGIEALSLMKKHSPDIVITDIKMPKCDGLELIKEAKIQGLELKFIIMSGYDDFQFVKIALQLGVENYLLKPIKKEELIDTINKVKEKLFLSNNFHPIFHSESQIIKDLIHNKYKNLDEFNKTFAEFYLKPPISILVWEGDFHPHKLKQILSKYIPKTLGIIFECDDSKLGVLVSLKELNVHGYASTYALGSKLINVTQTLLDTPVFCGIGDTIPNFTFAWKSYQSALDYLSYRLYENGNFIFDKNVLGEESTCPININNPYSEKLLEAILNYELDDIPSITQSFLNWILYIPTPPPSFVRGMCTHLIIDIQKKLSTYEELSEEILKDIPHKSISQCVTLGDIEQWIISTLSHYTLALHSHLMEAHNPVIDISLKYIHENITSKLTLEEVASQVYLSKNYFTSIFKEKTGKSFRNYVLHAKIEYAKKLLQQTDITVSNLSSLLGYEEYRSFNRAFKKNTGKTPSEYHKLYSTINN